MRLSCFICFFLNAAPPFLAPSTTHIIKYYKNNPILVHLFNDEFSTDYYIQYRVQLRSIASDDMLPFALNDCMSTIHHNSMPIHSRAPVSKELMSPSQIPYSSLHHIDSVIIPESGARTHHLASRALVLSRERSERIFYKHNTFSCYGASALCC